VELVGNGGSGGEAHRCEAIQGLQGAKATKTSTKERGKRGLAHRGLGLKGGPAQGGRRRGPGGGRGRRSWSGRWGASPVHKVPLVDAGMCCEDDTEVREVQGSLRWKNCGGASPGLAFLAFLGSFWAAGWCKGTRVAYVTHWGG